METVITLLIAGVVLLLLETVLPGMIAGAVGFWLSTTAVAALLVALVRWGLNRTRYAGWNRDIASLVHDDGGTTNRRR